MFLDTWDSKCGVLGADSDNEHIIRHISLGSITFDIRVVIDGNDFLLGVDLGGLRFVIFNSSLLMSQDTSNWFHDRSMFHSASGARREKWSKEEIIAGGDDNNIVVFSVEFFEK